MMITILFPHSPPPGVSDGDLPDRKLDKREWAVQENPETVRPLELLPQQPEDEALQQAEQAGQL